MTINKNKSLIDQISASSDVSKYLKIGMGIIGAVVGIYALGHVFKISAHCVRGFKELKTSIINE